MTLYWDLVLNEVLSKDNIPHDFSFTNIKNRHGGLIKEPLVPCLIIRPKARKFYLGEKYPGIYFTERERQTIFYFLQGKTTAQVGVCLNLSPRTVEYYLKNMKSKLNCQRKSELIGKIFEIGFTEKFKDPE